MKNKIRYLKPQELDLIKCLVQGKVQDQILNELQGRLVNDLIDDGLSIEFFIKKNDTDKIKSEISAVFYDDDDVSILVYITITQSGNLYDMDLSKDNGTPIVKYPYGLGEPLLFGEGFTDNSPIEHK